MFGCSPISYLSDSILDLARSPLPFRPGFNVDLNLFDEFYIYQIFGHIAERFRESAWLTPHIFRLFVKIRQAIKSNWFGVFEFVFVIWTWSSIRACIYQKLRVYYSLYHCTTGAMYRYVRYFVRRKYKFLVAISKIQSTNFCDYVYKFTLYISAVVSFTYWNPCQAKHISLTICRIV